MSDEQATTLPGTLDRNADALTALSWMKQVPTTRSGCLDRLRANLIQSSMSYAIWGWDVGQMIEAMYNMERDTKDGRGKITVKECISIISKELGDHVPGTSERSMHSKLKLFRTFPQLEQVFEMGQNGLTINHLHALGDTNEDIRNRVLQEVYNGECRPRELASRIAELVAASPYGGALDTDLDGDENDAPPEAGNSNDEDGDENDAESGEGEGGVGGGGLPPLPGAGVDPQQGADKDSLNKFSEIFERGILKLQEYRDDIEGMVSVQIPEILQKLEKEKPQLPVKVSVEVNLSGQMLTDSLGEMANNLMLCIERMCAVMDDVDMPPLRMPSVTDRRAKNAALLRKVK